MEISKVLANLGLNEKETQIYLTCLELGADTVVNIAKKAEIKRPTTYVVLESLIAKGLISKTPKQTTTLYTAEKPEKLLSSLQKQEKILQEALPFLQSLANKSEVKPKIKIYEGRAGLDRVYDDIAKHDEIHWYASLKDVGDEIIDKFENMMKRNKKAIMWDLVGNSEFEKNYAKNRKIKRHKIRILPDDLKISNVDSCIYGDKFAIFSIKKDIFVVVIESEEIANSFRSLYKLAWRASKEP